MALKSCRECGVEVSTDAKVCPHCGVKSPTHAPMNKKVLLLAVGAFVAFSLMFQPKGPPPNPAADSARVQADQRRELVQATRWACQSAIEQQLKAPKSAKFDTEAGFDPDSGHYINVNGTVTAVNSFNAPLTTTIACRYDTLTQRFTRAELIE